LKIVARIFNFGVETVELPSGALESEARPRLC
jgi:hypothetical protein